jgi:outer membrane protein insertion porin family
VSVNLFDPRLTHSFPCGSAQPIRYGRRSFLHSAAASLRTVAARPFPHRVAHLIISGVLLVMLGSARVFAATVEDLDPGKTYQVSRISIAGNSAFSDSELLAEMKTKQQPPYTFWKKPPLFDPEIFSTDLKRLRRFYEAHGFYSATVNYDLQPDDHHIAVTIRVDENKPVTVQSIHILLDEHDLPQGQSPYDRVVLKKGGVFTEDAYQRGEEALGKFYRDAGYAHIEITRSARVNLTANQARVWYFIHRGVRAAFGNTEVAGERKVDPRIILRELTYQPGEQFSQSKLDQSRDQILKLGLFAIVRFEPQLKSSNPRVVPIKLFVEEKPKHEIQIGGGYNTESQLVAHFQWTDRNWLGNGRQLSILLGYSNINSTADITLRQPFFLDIRGLTGSLDLREDVQQVPTYTLFASRFVPRLEYAFSPALTGYLSYQIEYAKLTSVDRTVITALSSVRNHGIVSGPSAGIALNTTDEPFNPHKGYVLTVDAMEAGKIFGGDFDYYRIAAEIKHYQSIGLGTILATRLKLGTGDSLGSKNRYPLFDRFYAGGEGSVRGYRYWRLGPESSRNVPLGGLSDIEGSVELRHQVWEKLWGAVFLDFGQLSLHPYDFPVSNLRFAVGPAFSYMTPVGPIRIDLGIPFRKPRGDQGWQIYFSIGQFF